MSGSQLKERRNSWSDQIILIVVMKSIKSKVRNGMRVIVRDIKKIASKSSRSRDIKTRLTVVDRPNSEIIKNVMSVLKIVYIMPARMAVIIPSSSNVVTKISICRNAVPITKLTYTTL